MGSEPGGQPWEPGGSQIISHQPAPASSTAVVQEPLCSPSAHHQYGANFAVLPSSIIAEAGESLTSSLRGPDSASAPSSLIFTVTRRSTRLPHSSSSALVGRWPAIASGLHSSCYTLSLCPTGSVGLISPSSSTLVLTLAPRILCIPLARWVSVSALGSSTTYSAAIGQPLLLHGSSLRRLHRGVTILAVAWVLLGSSYSKSLLSPPFFITSLVSVCRPPPGCVRPSPEPPPKFPPIPSLCCSMVRGHAIREGGWRYARILDCLCHFLPLFLFLFFDILSCTSPRLI